MNKTSKVRVEGRRQAKTGRGQDVRKAVTAAARELLRQRFYDEITIVELADKANVARASLVLQFPGGWSDVLCELASEELNLDEASEVVESTKGLTRAQRLFRLLETLLDRADTSGMLYPSLRAATFNYRVENRFYYRISYEGCWELVVNLLAGRMPLAKGDAIEQRVLDLADGLLTLALDLASGGDAWEMSWEQRRAALRAHVEVTVAAVKPEKMTGKRR